MLTNNKNKVIELIKEKLENNNIDICNYFSFNNEDFIKEILSNLEIKEGIFYTERLEQIFDNINYFCNDFKYNDILNDLSLNHDKILFDYKNNFDNIYVFYSKEDIKDFLSSFAYDIIKELEKFNLYNTIESLKDELLKDDQNHINIEGTEIYYNFNDCDTFSIDLDDPSDEELQAFILNNTFKEVTKTKKVSI